MTDKFKLNKEKEEVIIEQIKDYFATERDEEIGYLASKLLLDFILDKIAPEIYNQALSDVVYFMNEKIEDIYSLEK